MHGRNLLAVALAALAACTKGGGGSSAPPVPEVAHATQGIGGSILEVAIVDSAVFSGTWTHDVEFDLGSGYLFRRPPIEESPAAIRVPVPLGTVNPGAGIETGEIWIRVVRTNDGKSSYSAWKPFFVGQLTGGFFPPPGTVAEAAAKAAGSLVVHGVGDAWLVDENALGQLDFDAVLTAAAVEFDGFDVLRDLVERAMNGEVVAIGVTPSGNPIIFEAASLPVVDRLIGTANGALAMELGSLPPDPQWFPEFYRAVTHDFEDDAADSARIAFGAMRFSLELYEAALAADGASVAEFDAPTLGAIAWFDAFSNGFGSAFLMDSLPAQAGVSQGASAIVSVAANQGLWHAEEIAFDHFGPASFFWDSYGSELSYAGGAFVEGLAAKHNLSANLKVGFAIGLIPSSGLPPPEFTIEAAVNLAPTEYTVVVTTVPPLEGQLVSVRTVGLDGWIGGQDLVTDFTGSATAGPFTNGAAGSFDIVTALNPEAGGSESQSGIIATFP